MQRLYNMSWRKSISNMSVWYWRISLLSGWHRAWLRRWRNESIYDLDWRNCRRSRVVKWSTSKKERWIYTPFSIRGVEEGGREWRFIAKKNLFDIKLMARGMAVFGMQKMRISVHLYTVREDRKAVSRLLVTWGMYSCAGRIWFFWYSFLLAYTEGEFALFSLYCFILMAHG